MAKERKPADLVSDMVDDVPAKASPVAVTTLMDRPAFADAGPGAGAGAPEPASEEPADDANHPYGWLIKHPGYGALRVRKDQAKTEEQAIEVYRKARCPHLSRAQLEDTGLRLSVRSFIPADTERGK